MRKDLHHYLGSSYLSSFTELVLRESVTVLPLLQNMHLFFHTTLQTNQRDLAQMFKQAAHVQRLQSSCSSCRFSSQPVMLCSVSSPFSLTDCK